MLFFHELFHSRDEIISMCIFTWFECGDQVKFSCGFAFNSSKCFVRYIIEETFCDKCFKLKKSSIHTIQLSSILGLTILSSNAILDAVIPQN